MQRKYAVRRSFSSCLSVTSLTNYTYAKDVAVDAGIHRVFGCNLATNRRAVGRVKDSQPSQVIAKLHHTLDHQQCLWLENQQHLFAHIAHLARHRPSQRNPWLLKVSSQFLRSHFCKPETPLQAQDMLPVDAGQRFCAALWPCPSWAGGPRRSGRCLRQGADAGASLRTGRPRPGEPKGCGPNLKTARGARVVGFVSIYRGGHFGCNFFSHSHMAPGSATTDLVGSELAPGQHAEQHLGGAAAGFAKGQCKGTPRAAPGQAVDCFGRVHDGCSDETGW